MASLAGASGSGNFGDDGKGGGRKGGPFGGGGHGHGHGHGRSSGAARRGKKRDRKGGKRPVRGPEIVVIDDDDDDDSDSADRRGPQLGLPQLPSTGLITQQDMDDIQSLIEIGAQIERERAAGARNPFSSSSSSGSNDNNGGVGVDLPPARDSPPRAVTGPAREQPVAAAVAVAGDVDEGQVPAPAAGVVDAPAPAAPSADNDFLNPAALNLDNGRAPEQIFDEVTAHVEEYYNDEGDGNGHPDLVWTHEPRPLRTADDGVIPGAGLAADHTDPGQVRFGVEAEVEAGSVMREQTGEPVVDLTVAEVAAEEEILLEPSFSEEFQAIIAAREAERREAERGY